MARSAVSRVWICWLMFGYVADEAITVGVKYCAFNKLIQNGDNHTQMV